MSLVTITKENFNEEVGNFGETVLVDFWADWCGPCKMISPVVDQIAEEYAQYKVGKINVDEQPELAASFNVTSIPTFAVFKGGKLVKTSVGVMPKNDILDLLN